MKNRPLKFLARLVAAAFACSLAATIVAAIGAVFVHGFESFDASVGLPPSIFIRAVEGSMILATAVMVGGRAYKETWRIWR